MKRFVLCSLVVLVLAALAGPAVAACMRTGVQTDSSSSVDTVFFYQQGRRFDASSLRIWLSTSASGNATIRRGVKIGADSIYFFEDAQTIRPGGVFESNDDGVYCFALTKTSSDALSWSGSQCADGSGINSLESTIIDLLEGPTPVAVSEHTLWSGLHMQQTTAASATNLKAGAGGGGTAPVGNRRTFPVTAGANVDGAKALELIIDWTNFEHGGFRVEHVFANSSTDTAAFFYGGAGRNLDTLAVTDSVALCTDTRHAVPGVVITPDVAGSIVIRIPAVPGAGYYFCRIYPWGSAHGNWITGTTGTLRVVY